MNLIDYIVFTVFDYFDKKDSKNSKNRTISFMTILEVSTLVPLFIMFNLVFRFFESPKNPDPNLKYQIGIPLAIALLIINKFWLNRKLTDENFEKFKTISPTHCRICVWLIFITPIIFVFVIPVLYGALNGTLKIVGK